MMPQRFAEFSSWVLSTSLGSFGILFFLASFGDHRFGLSAFICLGLATALCCLLEQPSPASRK